METDTIFSVLQYCDINHVAKCFITCKMIKKLDTEYLWKCLNNTHYGVTTKYNTKWYDTYREFSPVVKRVNEKLYEIFGNYMQEFKDIMCKTHAAISGSFIIQSLLGTYYENSDIDIYVPFNKSVSYINDFILKTTTPTKLSNDSAYALGMDYTIIKKVNTYTINNCIIQIIYLNVNNNIDAVYDFIKNDFDFDICKNIYYYDGNDNVILYNPHQLLNKYTEFKTSKKLGNSIERYYKYMKRGFVFTNIDKLSYTDVVKNNRYFGSTKGDMTNIIIFEIAKTDDYVNDKQIHVFTNYNVSSKLAKFCFNINPVVIENNDYTNKFTFINDHIDCDHLCPIKLFNPSIEHYHNGNCIYKMIDLSY